MARKKRHHYGATATAVALGLVLMVGLCPPQEELTPGKEAGNTDPIQAEQVADEQEAQILEWRIQEEIRLESKQLQIYQPKIQLQQVEPSNKEVLPEESADSSKTATVESEPEMEQVKQKPSSALSKEETLSEENSLKGRKHKLTDKQFQLLCREVFAEAGNQSVEHQTAIAAVILNRTECDKFPNSLEEVISQKGQFASIAKYSFADVSEETREAVERAINGEDPSEKWLYAEATRQGVDTNVYASGGALYFYQPDTTPASELKARQGIRVKVQNGAHVFYRYWD